MQNVISTSGKIPYNDRLFKRGIRAWLHLSRFRWLERKCARYRPDLDLVIELGCFDGRALNHLHARPLEYYGFDANWEGGLDQARENHKHCGYHFLKCKTPEEMAIVNEKDKATLALSLETLEHIPESMLEGYLEKLARLTEGYVFITVPNEKGPVFLLKYLFKRFLLHSHENYEKTEIFWAAIGQTHRVRRDQHKGFDYYRLHKTLKKYFDHVESSGIPFSFLPLCLNSQVGFVMKSRQL